MSWNENALADFLQIDNTGMRLNRVPPLFGLHGVFSTTIELTMRGLAVEDLGLQSVHTLDETTEGQLVHPSEVYALDVSDPHEVNIVSRDDGETSFGGRFDDEHPRGWIDALARDIAPLPPCGLKGLCSARTTF